MNTESRSIMEQKIKQGDGALLGFFPLFFNLSETGRAVLVAKRYQELGGKVVFFSHGGDYEYFAEEQGFDIIRIRPLLDKEFVNRYFRIARGESNEEIYPQPLLEEVVENEITMFKKTKIKALVSTNNEPCTLSARAANIPLIAITTGPGRFHYSVPDMYENALIRCIPQHLKLPIFNWMIPRTKNHLKPFNTLAKHYKTKPFTGTMDLYYGDTTLVTNFLEFIDIFPKQQQFPVEDYIGIILLEEMFTGNFSEEQAEIANQEITNHLKGGQKTILFTMGSSGDKNLFLQILHELNKTSYRVVAVYTNILKEDELPVLHEHILLKKYVPSLVRVHTITDLSIIHGGQGTVYTAAYSGKPIIGYPMQFEQHLNLEKMVGHGAGLMLSMRYFSGEKLVKSIEHIFDHYNDFLRNTQILSKKLPQPDGDKNAARRILQILSKSKM
jgi:UDP:flavonoid glycosyltransferase YjiC (YdhE family)